MVGLVYAAVVFEAALYLIWLFGCFLIGKLYEKRPILLPLPV